MLETAQHYETLAHYNPGTTHQGDTGESRP